jgi:hypothetical protein
MALVYSSKRDKTAKVLINKQYEAWNGLILFL